MSRHPDFVPQGVIPAVLLPFHEDLSIDEPSFRAHLRDVGAVQGLSAITINAHSTEVVVFCVVAHDPTSTTRAGLKFRFSPG